MNGDNKDEAHRPRPLSAGIWTLFSWFRRSERSSSSESLSSVGSARTAVSFDFLSPGNCDIKNTPILFTTSLNPPSETYRKRLQERNLRRQLERDITLHRKYGLFRENGKEFEGFSLPPASRTVGNTCDQASRERRATSECLQRRAAYVPGKRRAPLPPVIATSVSLPRAHKRKRPAPKPPTKNTLKDNISTVKFMNNPVRMNSSSGPEENDFPDYEIVSSSSKTETCDKEVIITRVAKPRADKNFLKHIFDNRKRNSAAEATSVRLLPSISELDKQAAEIIENKKLRQNTNKSSPKSLNNSQLKTSYEGNSWFCTSCLRKYNSSISCCSYCLSDKNPYKRHSANLCPKSSICTQTNNIETAGSSQKNKDERKMLKDILKEMKDSLPKSNKYNKVNDVMTETPTLKIGSTLKEKYNDLTSQPSSSRNLCQIEKKSVSSPVSQIQKNFDQKNHISNQSVKGIVNSSELSKVNLILERKSYASSSTTDKHTVISLSEKELLQELNITKATEHNSIDNAHFKKSDNLINKSNTENQTSSSLPKSTDGKEIGKIISIVPHVKASNILDRRENFPKDQSPLNSDAQSKPFLSSSAASSKVENIPNMSSKFQFLKFTDSHDELTSATVVTSHSNDNNSKAETSNKNSQSNCADKKQTETKKDIKSKFQINNANKIISENDLESELKTTKTSNAIEPESNLHKPLKISSLLNPLCSPKITIVKSNNNLGRDSKELTKEVKQTATTKLESKVCEKIVPLVVNSEIKPIKEIELETKETANLQSLNTNTTLKDVSREQKTLPSLSAFSGAETVNPSNNIDKLNILDKRRHFINQLEQSIAKGDEAAAAEAAVKLAKLRLSCSVLSFSSQIVGESSNNKRQVFCTDTGPLSSNEKLLVDEPLDTVKSETEKLVEINTRIPKIDAGNIFLENKVSRKDFTEKPTKVELNLKPTFFACEPSSSSSFSVKSDDTVPINIWIEDKQAARGPIRLRISRKSTMADIKRQAEQSLGLAIQLQRWIVGRTLCTDDEATVVSLAGTDFRAPFYLCIVQSDQNKKSAEINEDVVNKELKRKNDSTTNTSGEFYTELMKLEKQSLVPNIEPFECGVCMEECAAGAGVVLRECIHTFCRDCLSDVVQHCQEPEVSCPAVGCTGVLQEREIRTIVSSEEYEKWLARGLATAESGTRNAFHCRTRDCSGWAFCDPGVTRFPCPVCNKTNCVQCQAIHEGETCAQYQKKLREAVAAAETNQGDGDTQAFLNSLISRGEALECPECKAIITKKWGCDWVKCSACKTEICWVTKGKRWGPGGRGDTSGGCRCGVDGQRCHPSCGYCH